MCVTVYSVYGGVARYFGTQNVKCKSNNADMLVSLKVQKTGDCFQCQIVTWPTDSNEFDQRMDSVLDIVVHTSYLVTMPLYNPSLRK